MLTLLFGELGADSINVQLPNVTNDAQAANTRLSNAAETAVAKTGEFIWGIIGPGIMGEMRRAQQTPEAMRGVPTYIAPALSDMARRQAVLDAFYDKQITALTAQYDANAQYYQELTSKDGFLVRGFHEAAAENASQSSASVASEILNLLEQKTKARAEVPPSHPLEKFDYVHGGVMLLHGLQKPNAVQL